MSTKAKSYNMQELKQKSLLTKDETCFYMGISIKMLARLINGGSFYPLLRIGYNRGRVFVNREKLDKWINEQDGSWKEIR